MLIGDNPLVELRKSKREDSSTFDQKTLCYGGTAADVLIQVLSDLVQEVRFNSPAVYLAQHRRAGIWTKKMFEPPVSSVERALTLGRTPL